MLNVKSQVLVKALEKLQIEIMATHERNGAVPQLGDIEFIVDHLKKLEYVEDIRDAIKQFVMNKKVFHLSIFKLSLRLLEHVQLQLPNTYP